MAVLIETDEWSEGVYQLEETDPVLGGAPNEATGAGVDNIPHLHLARRTRWLKTRVDALVSQVVAATTAVAGIVQLSNVLTSTSTSQALTAAQGKRLHDEKSAQASPALTGAPTADSPIASDNSTRIATTSWVRSAMATIAASAGFAVSPTQNGYLILPSWLGGLVLQWGSFSTSNGRATLIFPTTFPTACLAIVGSHVGAGGAMFVCDSGTAVTRSGFSAIVSSALGAVSTTTWSGTYFAVGH